MEYKDYVHIMRCSYISSVSSFIAVTQNYLFSWTLSLPFVL